MTEQNTPPNATGQPPKDSPPLFHEYGLLEQFNLPPKAIRFIRAHQRRIWTAVIACAALALLVAGIDAYLDHRLKKAAEALDAAMQAGEARRERLVGVARKYGSTPSALWAETALARLDEEDGKPADAIDRYRKLRGKFPRESPLQPMLLGKMAALEEQREQWDAALTLYRELSANNDFAADAYLGMGRIHEARGNKDEALAMYKKFVEFTAVSTPETGVDPRRQMVMSHVELMQGGFAEDPQAAEAAPQTESAPETPAASEQAAEPQAEAAPEAAPQAEAAPETPAASEQAAEPQVEAASEAAPQIESAPETPAAAEQAAEPQAEATPEAAPQTESAPEPPAASEQAPEPQAEATPEAAPQPESASDTPAAPEQPATPQPETPAPAEP